MKLYALRRISDGKFFVHTTGLGQFVMTATPVFWKTPDGIHINLKRVCSRFAPFIDKWGFQQKDWDHFDKRKLVGWEVLIVNAKVLSENFVPATAFVGDSLTPIQLATRRAASHDR